MKISHRRFAIISALVLSASPAAAQTFPRMDHSPAASAPRSAAMTAALPDTVRILAVMAEFRTDEDNRTSGNGTFGTVFPYDYGADILDPYPHDRAYFEAHLRFLENYIAKSSGGRTFARSGLFDSVVTLPKQIREYSYRRGESEKPVAELAAAAWTEADKAIPGFDFSAWDMFVVFHAGRGRDVDLAALQGVDPTPFDIPSLSFTLNAFRKHFGAEFEGIPVGGGAFLIKNSSIVPCTNTREIPLITGQTGLLELSINGLLAASFGTWAGLPDLFDTRLGRTGIGRFGLMDAESIFAFGGVCPPAPSAWEKQFLGWTAPREATAGKRSYLLTAYRTDQPSTADIIKAPITGKEYWLLENRQRDPGNNGQRVTMLSGGREIVMHFPKDTTGFEYADVTALKGVVIDVEDIDWSLPGGRVLSDGGEITSTGGILIWHIDEAVIEAGLADNKVNADPHRRGVDLEQAAGPQDIGETIPSVFGSSIGNGSPLDYWFRGNVSPLYENAFGASTTPDTRANSGAFTHVTIGNFDVSGPVMSLDIEAGDNTIAPMPGWPVDLSSRLPEQQSELHTVVFDIDGDASEEIFAAAGYRSGNEGPGDTVRVFGFRTDATPVLSGSLDPLSAEIPGMRRILSPPMIGDEPAYGGPVMVVAGSDGDRVSLVLLAIRDLDNDRRFDPLDRIDLHASQIRDLDASWHMLRGGLMYLTTGSTGDTLHHPVAGRSYALRGAVGAIAATAYADSLILLDNGDMLSTGAGLESSFPSMSAAARGTARNCVVADFDGDLKDDGAVLRDKLSLHLSGRTEAGLPVSSAYLLSHRPVLSAADIDGDGRLDVVIADSSSVLVFNAALASAERYPARVSARCVLSARLNGDRRDALFVVGDGVMAQLGTGALQAGGFPIPLPTGASAALTRLKEGGGFKLGISVAGGDRRVNLYRTPNAADDHSGMWRQMYGDAQHGNRISSRGGAIVPESVFFPPERCYNWPNPTYESITKIRCYVSQDADITVKIYDQASEKIDELHARAVGGLDNEIDWNVSGIQSGVYLAHVKAAGNGVSGEKIIKIAVVK